MPGILAAAATRAGTRGRIDDRLSGIAKRPPSAAAGNAVAPASRLRDDRAIHLLHPCVPARDARLRRQCAVVEKVALYAVRDLHPEFRVHAHRHPEMPRINLLRRAVGERILRRRRADEITIHIEHRKLKVVDKKPESEVAFSRADGRPVVVRAADDGIVRRAAPDTDKHVIDKVLLVDQPLKRRVARTVGIATERAEVARIVFESREAEIECRTPHAARALVESRGAEFLIVANDVVVLGRTAEVVCTEVAVHTFINEEEAPVLSVDVQIAEVPLLRDAACRELRIAAENVLKLIRAGLVRVVPRDKVIPPQIECIRPRRPALTEQREIEMRRTVFLSEAKLERMLRVPRVPTRPAADADSASTLEAAASRRLNVLQRHRALPFAAFVERVCVNAGARVEEIVEIHDDGERRHGAQVILDGRLVGRFAGDVRIHAIIDVILPPLGRPAFRRSAAGRLFHDIGREQIGARHQRRRVVPC